MITTPTKDKPPHRLPPNINKELEKRKIGNRFVNFWGYFMSSFCLGFVTNMLGVVMGMSLIHPPKLYLMYLRTVLSERIIVNTKLIVVGSRR